MKTLYRRTTTWLIVMVIILSLVFRTFVYVSYVVNGESMEPTLHDGNLMMVNKISDELEDIERFDIIVFHADENNDYVKRVVGLPGDTINYQNDQLYINGDHIKESFLKPLQTRYTSKTYTEDFTLEDVTGSKHVPEGELFVLGDNRPDSLDSREIGFISVDQLVGKVDITYWPVADMQLSFS